jgi:hypothetical protein
MGVMTKSETSPDREVAISGMAHYAGSGPPGKTCGDCLHRGYYRIGKNGKSRRVTGCMMYRKLAGRHGPPINRHNHSCKHFQQRDR